MMEYKGYIGSVEYDDESETLYGKVQGIRDIISYEGQSIKELKKAFQGSVDDYLEFCKIEGEEPEKPYSGKFNLRIPPELHKNIAIAAMKAGMSLNSYIKKQLENLPPDKSGG